LSQKLIQTVKLFLSIIVLLSTVTLAYSMENGEVIAKGDGFVVTREEVNLLKARMHSYFNTTEAEYCRALLKMKLFSMEAHEQKIDLEKDVALELAQMIEQKLSAIYISKLVEKYVMLPGTIASYYYSHTDEFLDKEGNSVGLDDALRKKIKEKIALRKKSELANGEMDILLKKYHVNILDSSCIKKD